ncbi:DUF6395 domain-containing protein [Microbulbifer thermotolerans]|uniref:7-cyano-7-deazaguanine synthase (Queuosine biosynthesis) n=1 Tax=Microbulbifer thermotolerans TaxID=252514 RepID=A0A143HME6_MICTH|nr:DUF6395 domain-containing protein [Microbulbifer thermotolerans]AMX02666.1 hypothetical protein A3224_08775 [Microbulbifer thermotolerans]
MKVFFNEIENRIWEFSVELEEGESKKAFSFNAGRQEMELQDTSCRFYFDFKPNFPHPDLLALGLLKIFSPFVHRKISFPYPISPAFNDAIKQHYGFFSDTVDENLLPRKSSSGRKAVSFSGGADSVAAASLMPDDTVLIQCCRVKHQNIPLRERWYKVDANKKTLENMPECYSKILVETDFEYLMWNGSYCVYPDNYSFTIPCIFLADHFDIDFIATGDIHAGLTGNETMFNKKFEPNGKALYKAVGLELDSPVKSISEVGTTLINVKTGLHEITTTCAYGEFKKPCMKCIKCFRKYLISAAVGEVSLDEAVLSRFFQHPPVIKFLTNTSRQGIEWIPTLKYIFNKIKNKNPIMRLLEEKVSIYPIDPGYVDKYYSPAVSGLSDVDVKKSVQSKIKNILPSMTDKEESEFQSLNTVKFFEEKKYNAELAEKVREIEFFLAIERYINNRSSEKRIKFNDVNYLVKKYFFLQGDLYPNIISTLASGLYSKVAGRISKILFGRR